MSRPGRKGSSVQPNWFIYVIFAVANALAFFSRPDQALMMTVPTMFVMYNGRLVNQATLIFTLVSVFGLLSTLSTDTLYVLAAHTFLYNCIYWMSPGNSANENNPTKR